MFFPHHSAYWTGMHCKFYAELKSCLLYCPIERVIAWEKGQGCIWILFCFPFTQGSWEAQGILKNETIIHGSVEWALRMMHYQKSFQTVLGDDKCQESRKRWEWTGVVYSFSSRIWCQTALDVKVYTCSQNSLLHEDYSCNMQAETEVIN